MAKSVTRYDEVGNAVIREARPASNVRTAPRDVKAKGAAAVAAWNKANQRQPGKTGEQAMQIVERQIFKRAADMRAKKTIASTARSFTGGQLLEALSANNGPKVPADAPVTQKRAAIASGMAARAANRTEAGGSDGGPKRRAAERFARVARGEKPFGGDSAARANSELAARKDKVRSGTKVSGDVTMAALSGRAGGSKPRGVGRAGQLIIAEAEGHMMQVARDTQGKVKFDGSRVDTVEKAKAYLKARGLPSTVGEIKSKPATPKSRAEMPSAMATVPSRDPAVVEANRAAGRARQEALIASEKAADERMAAKPAKASRAGKSGRVAGMSADSPFPSSMTKGSRTGTAADTARSPSFIDKVNAAQAASDAARKSAPKPPATPPGPREHWERIGADGPKLKDVVRPGPGQPVGTLTEQQKLALVKSHGMGGAMVASQMPTYPPRGVTNDSAMGMKPPAPPPAALPSSGMKMPTWGQVNTGLAVVGTGVAAAQAFNKAKQEGKSTGEAMGAGALAATPGALMLGAQPIGNALSKAGGGMLKVAEGMAGALGPMGPISTPAMAVTGSLAAGGMAAQAAGAALKIAGKVAAPAMAAWGAYQGAKEDDNKLRGAARGALRSLDPSAIVTGIGAGTGLMKDGRGLGERAYDAAFGGPTQGRLSSTQAQTFAKADTNYDHMGQGQPQATGERPGWSPEARIAAAQARGAVNLPYGGDPTQAPGYTPPKDRRPY